MKYRYSARTKSGKVEKGSVEARDSAEAAELLRREGLLVVALKKDSGLILAKLFVIGWVPNVVKVTFAKHMSLMIKAGLPVDEAVMVLRDQAQGRFRRVLDGIYKAVETGRPLSDGFAEYPHVFSELFISTVRAGEASGTLEGSLDDLADQLSKSYELERKIRGALIYPAIVMTVALAVGMGLSIFVLPRIIQLFSSITVNLPVSTVLLIDVSKFLSAHGVVFFIGLIAGFIFLLQLLKLPPVRPISHAVLLRLPVFGTLVRNYNLAVFSRTMATLLKSGISIGDAFQICSDTMRNVRYKNALLRVRAGTETGEPASTVLEEFRGLFPSIATRMLAVGERTGKLEETFGYLAAFYEGEVDDMTKNLSTILEPVLLVLIGLAVAFVAISIIAPIYNFVGSIDRL